MSRSVMTPIQGCENILMRSERLYTLLEANPLVIPLILVFIDYNFWGYWCVSGRTQTSRR